MIGTEGVRRWVWCEEEVGVGKWVWIWEVGVFGVGVGRCGYRVCNRFSGFVG